MARPRKYTPLANYLAALPPEQPAVRLTFTELVALVGPLPAGALIPKFWASSPTAQHWRPFGWRAHLQYGQRLVTFTRVPTRQQRL